MAIKSFPEVEEADDTGLLAVGGDLEVESLLLAYRSGIFPWPFSPEYPAWFAPPERAVIMLEEFHVARSLKKERARAAYEFAIDRDFETVIKSCSELTNRGRQGATWITPQLIDAYLELHRAGHAHSVECYHQEKLIGGLYGVAIGKMFAGESMFFRGKNGSKLALWYLVEHLSAKGVSWIDVQIITPFLKNLGARLISRAKFMQLLDEAINSQTKLF